MSQKLTNKMVSFYCGSEEYVNPIHFWINFEFVSSYNQNQILNFKFYISWGKKFADCVKDVNRRKNLEFVF